MRGVPKPRGPLTRSVDNKGYAVDAVHYLWNDESWLDKLECLWSKVIRPKIMKHQGQIDVVFALWKNDLIIQAPITEQNPN